MMLSFLLAMILNFIPNFAFYYNEGPFTHTEAKAYCKSIGSYMATIITIADRLEADIAIRKREEAWIGLVHVLVPKLTYCYWHYPEESDPNICPIKRDCVDFWLNGSPIKVERGGNECAIYYPDLAHRVGGVNNDVDCDTRKPVLCHENPEICDVENYRCGGPVQWCALGCAFGINGYCDMDANGESVCVSQYWCNKEIPCNPDNGNADCAEGSVCVGNNDLTNNDCCGGPNCTPLCGEDVDERRRMTDNEPQDLCEGSLYSCE